MNTLDSRYDCDRALFRAAETGDVDAARVALATGANGRALHRGWSALHKASAHNSTEVVALILDAACDVDLTDNTRCTPLIRACSAGAVDAAALLIDHRADLGHVESTGQTPLHCAACCGSAPTVRLLLGAEASVDPIDRKSASPLFAACAGGHLEAAAALIASGANVAGARACRQSPLYAASKAGESEVADLLLALGADPNGGSRQARRLPLHVCTSPSVVAVLVEGRANVNAAAAARPRSPTRACTGRWTWFAP